MKNQVKPIPYQFVLDELSEMNLSVRQMFGCHALYDSEKILLILRKKDDLVYDNGIWIATVFKHHVSLRQELPALRSIRIFGKGETGWQNLPERDSEFESLAFKLCELVKTKDERIGKIPKKKKRSVKSKSNRKVKSRLRLKR